MKSGLVENYKTEYNLLSVIIGTIQYLKLYKLNNYNYFNCNNVNFLCVSTILISRVTSLGRWRAWVWTTHSLNSASYFRSVKVILINKRSGIIKVKNFNNYFCCIPLSCLTHLTLYCTNVTSHFYDNRGEGRNLFWIWPCVFKISLLGL